MEAEAPHFRNPSIRAFHFFLSPFILSSHGKSNSSGSNFSFNLAEDHLCCPGYSVSVTRCREGMSCSEPGAGRAEQHHEFAPVKI